MSEELTQEQIEKLRELLILDMIQQEWEGMSDYEKELEDFDWPKAIRKKSYSLPYEHREDYYNFTYEQVLKRIDSVLARPGAQWHEAMAVASNYIAQFSIAEFNRDSSRAGLLGCPASIKTKEDYEHWGSVEQQAKITKDEYAVYGTDTIEQIGVDRDDGSLTTMYDYIGHTYDPKDLKPARTNGWYFTKWETRDVDFKPLHKYPDPIIWNNQLQDVVSDKVRPTLMAMREHKTTSPKELNALVGIPLRTIERHWAKIKEAYEKIQSGG